MEYKLKSTQY